MKELKELYRYRNLIFALVGRQLAGRYRGSALGFLWSFLNPLFFMLIYTLVFKYYIRFDSVENYSIYLFCGLLPWTWMSSGLLEAINSISASGSLITKSMFPPQVLPVVSVVTNLVHYLLSLILLGLFMVFFSVPFTVALLFLPVVVFLQLITMYGWALLLASLNVFYRDILHVTSNLLNLLFFLCPILYPPTTVPEQFQFTIFLNPFALLITAYHNVILDGHFPSRYTISFLFLFAILIFVLGRRVYRGSYESFAECL